MSVEQINAIKHAVMEVIVLGFFLVLLTMFARETNGVFDKD